MSTTQIEIALNHLLTNPSLQKAVGESLPNLINAGANLAKNPWVRAAGVSALGTAALSGPVSGLWGIVKELHTPASTTSTLQSQQAVKSTEVTGQEKVAETTSGANVDVARIQQQTQFGVAPYTLEGQEMQATAQVASAMSTAIGGAIAENLRSNAAMFNQNSVAQVNSNQQSLDAARLSIETQAKTSFDKGIQTAIDKFLPRDAPYFDMQNAMQTSSSAQAALSSGSMAPQMGVNAYVQQGINARYAQNMMMANGVSTPQSVTGISYFGDN